MATKAELEQQRNQYSALFEKAFAAEGAHLYREAIGYAIASLPFVDGMMQFERKYENHEFRSVETIDILLKYAPLLLHFPSLDELGVLLKSQKRIDKNASDDLATRLDAARQRMWDAHRLWDHLEENPGARQDELRKTLGGDQDAWRTLAETWQRAGILLRTPEGGSYRLSFQTRMHALARAKCPNCGLVARASKSKLLEPQTCPKCRKTAELVLLPDDATTEQTR